MRTVNDIVEMAAKFEGDDGMDRQSRLETPEARAAITSAIDQEWAESSALLSAMGLTAEQYRLSRLRDVGLETLPSAAR